MEVPKGLIHITVSRILEEYDLESIDMIITLTKCMTIFFEKLNIKNPEILENFINDLDCSDSFKNHIRVAVAFLLLIDEKISKKMKKMEEKN